MEQLGQLFYAPTAGSFSVAERWVQYGNGMFYHVLVNVFGPIVSSNGEFSWMAHEYSTTDAHQPVKTPRWERATVLAILLLHIGMCAWGAWRHSPTMDEPAYLVAGVSHWEFGRFDLCKVCPPLVRLVAGGVVAIAQPNVDWKNYQGEGGNRSAHAVGRDFLISSGTRSYWLFSLGRWACLPFTVVGAWVSYRWSRELFGAVSGISCLLLWCFSPTVLANAQLLTPDIGVTSLSLATCYACWRWSKLPTWPGAAGVGFVLGIAVLAKTNAVVLAPALVVAIAVNAIWSQRLRRWKSLVQVSLMLMTALYTINLGYGFEGSFRKLGDYEFISHTFAANPPGNRFQGTSLANVPVPFPAPFLEGIDIQREDFENTPVFHITYFRGEWHKRGWWWYYLYVIAVKVPVGTLALFVAGFTTLMFRQDKETRTVACYVLIPAILLLALPSSQTGFGGGVRYVLPAFPFGYLIASASLSRRAIRFVAILALGFTLASSLSVYPHNLSYFNEAAGGPTNGDDHILGANVDFGQDFLFVRDWIESNLDEQPVQVALWSWPPRTNTSLKFENHTAADAANATTGLWIVSVMNLRHYFPVGQRDLSHFLDQEPIGRIGYSVRIYRDPERSVASN